MSQYNTGTIAITNGSAAVVGTSTLWAAEAAAGDWLMVLGDGLVYEILSVTDDTNLTLTNTFQGSTAATATYVITRDFTPNYGFALMGRADQETAAIYTRAITDIDSALTSYTVGAAALEAQHWANNAEDVLVQEGDLVDDYSSLHWSIKAEYWATTTGALVEATDYSAKEFAIGTFVPAGSSKQWASEVEDTIVASGLYSSLHYSAKSATSAAAALVSEDNAEDWATLTGALVETTDYSAREYAIGTFVPAGSSKQWASEVEDTIVASGLYSALHYSAKATASADLAEDWATLTGAQVAATDYSSKEYAIGTVVGAGSSKQWATEVEDTIVASGLYSALHYAAKADDSKVAAELAETNAETAETNAAATYDLFDDRMLGSKTVDPTLDNDSNALVEGAMYWNSTNKVLRIYDGAAFQDTGSATANITEWTATAGQTTFSGTDDNALALAYTAGYLMVFRNGTLLDPDDYTATSGSTVVLDTGADLNDTLNFIGFGTFDVANTYTQTVADATFAPIARSNKNLIINGGFSVAQRDTSFGSLTAAAWTLDRWRYTEQSTATITVTQTALSVGEAAGSHYWFMSVGVADTALVTSDHNLLTYKIEGYDAAALNWNRSTQAAKKDITVSFWHAHTLTGTHCIAIRNSATDRSYVAEYTQAVTNTWEYTTITIPAPTDGTWLVGNDNGLSLNFCIAVGTTYATSNADTWETSNYIGTTNQVNNVNNTANRIRLAGVQLEIGTVATDFEIRPFGEELALCQRYYEKTYPQGTVPGTSWGNGAFFVYITGLSSTARNAGSSLSFATAKADIPTVTLYSSSTGASGKVRDNAATAADLTGTVFNANENGFRWSCSIPAKTDINITGHWTAEAEL